MNSEDREYLHGPLLAEWLEQVGAGREIRAHFGDNGVRTLYRWKHEQAYVTIWTLDRYLTATDLLIQDIPEEVWADEPIDRNTRPYPPEVVERALSLVHGGKSKKAVARALGCDPKTVKNWLDKAA